jgi:hypothetical protein
MYTMVYTITIMVYTMVYVMVYTMVYMMVYTLLCIMVYILVYTFLLYGIYDDIYYGINHGIYHVHYRDCTGPHARTYCAQQHATATASHRQALHNGVACVLKNISQAGLQTGAVASCVRRSVRMQRPVRCGGQCDAAASATRQGCVQSISGAPSRTPNTVSLM